MFLKDFLIAVRADVVGDGPRGFDHGQEFVFVGCGFTEDLSHMVADTHIFNYVCKRAEDLSA